MVSSDTVVGIVGAVILTGAMIAVFYYENSNANDGDDGDVGTGANLYSYTFEEHPHPLFSDATGSATAGTAVNIPLNIQNQVPIQDYLYSIAVTVTWTDDEAATPLNGADTFSLALNDGTTNLATADSGASPRTMTYTLDVPKPADVTARGDTPEAANASLMADYPETVDYSNLSLVVTLTGTGAQAAQIDNQNSFTYTVIVSYWKPILV